MRYDDKTAVIVGGSHGIGLATARLLVEGGARVLVTGRSPGALQTAAAELGGQARVLRSDATDIGAISRLAKTVRETLGEIDLLHVNAGIAELEPLDRVTEASFDRQFGVNAKGTFFTVQRLAPLMRPGGAIVMTSSVADEGGEPGMTVYAATKAAVVSFVSGFAVELLPRVACGSTR